MRGESETDILIAERKLRGVEQFDKLRKADIVFVSFGKSGRTWLRVMISHLFRVMYQLPENAILGFDNFHNFNKGYVCFEDVSQAQKCIQNFHNERPFGFNHKSLQVDFWQSRDDISQQKDEKSNQKVLNLIQMM